MRFFFSAAALAACTLLPLDAGAQRVFGTGQDATTPRRGVLRTTFSGENVLLRGRWADGTAQELGAGLSSPLAPGNVVEMAAISGILGTFSSEFAFPTLGSPDVDLRQRLAFTRLGFEYGVTDRLAVRVQAPFVRARAEALLRLNPTGATAGLNPSLTGTGVAAGNRAVVDAYQNAVSSLTTRRDACAGDPGAFAECATINAETALVEAAIARGTQFATALTTIYGADGLAPGQRYVPMVGSSIEAIFAGIGDGLRTDFTRWGVNDVTASTGLPLGAQTHITAGELERLMAADEGDGFAARPLTRSARQDLGDVDIGLTFTLFDAYPSDSARRAVTGLGFRQSLGLTYRLGGGNFDLPDNLIDLGTGSGHDAIALHSFTDVMLNDRFWATVTVGWGLGAAHERVIRVPQQQGDDLIPVQRQALVRITPASMLELRVSPRYQLNDYFGFGAEWRFRSRGEDAVRAVGSSLAAPGGLTVPSGDGAMQTPSNSNEHRWAWSVAYSTLGAESRGKARMPLEIVYSHEQSVASFRGIVPRRWEDRVALRFYTRLLGR
jgi:hypothetical protein